MATDEEIMKYAEEQFNKNPEMKARVQKLIELAVTAPQDAFDMQMTVDLKEHLQIEGGFDGVLLWAKDLMNNDLEQDYYKLCGKDIVEKYNNSIYINTASQLQCAANILDGMFQFAEGELYDYSMTFLHHAFEVISNNPEYYNISKEGIKAVNSWLAEANRRLIVPFPESTTTH